jgi:1-phosphatidylinositol-3-phosphate 5-kinase
LYYISGESSHVTNQFFFKVIPEAYGPNNPVQGAFKTEPGLSTDLPLVPEVTPAGPHPSPELDHIEQSYLDEASTSNRPLSPSRVTSCSPPFLTDTSRLPPLAVAHFSDNEMSSSDTGRHSIIKTLSSLWNYQGAEFLPLEYPQSEFFLLFNLLRTSSEILFDH